MGDGLMYMPKSAVLVDDSSTSVSTPASTSGYMPKSAVLIDSSSQAPSSQEGLLGKALNIIAPGVGTLASAVAQNPHMILPGLANIAKSVPNALAQQGAGLMSTVLPAPISQVATSLAQEVPTPSQQGSNLLNLAGNTALGASGLEAIPELGALGAMGGKAILSKLSDAAGFNADAKANSFIDSLLGNNSFSKSHLPVINELRQNYNNAKTLSNSQYESILNSAKEQGYTGGTQFPGIHVATDGKSIVPNNFQSDLNNVDLSLYSKKIQDALKPLSQQINPNLSFSDAHDLQSELGTEGAKLRTSADGTQRYLGGELLGLRDTLKNDITGSLLANNDTDLAQQYHAASDFFKNNVAPYRENSVIRNVVTKKGNQEINPATIGNVLKKDDGSILPIVNQLSPESKNLLLANQLKSATNIVPQASGGIERNTTAQNLINAYGKLDNKGFGDLATPQNNQAIASIMQDLSRKQSIEGILNKLKLPAAIVGSAALGTAGYHTAKEFL